MSVCSYCGTRRAVNKDHVIPRSIAKLQRPTRKHPDRKPLPEHLLVTVPSCFECNIRKQSRRLIPASWADRVDLLNELIPGSPWRVWDGDTKSPAFREAHA